MVCAKLHNVCVDANIPFDGGVYEDYDIGDMPSSVYLNLYNSENDGLPPVNSHTCSLKRMFITEQLEQRGYTRPARCAQNTRA